MSAQHTQGQLLELAKAAQRMPWETCETDVPLLARHAFKQAITADHYLEVMAQRDWLLAALKNVRSGLSNGLWDYGPGQDENTKCNAFIEKIDAAIAKVEGGCSMEMAKASEEDIDAAGDALMKARQS